MPTIYQFFPKTPVFSKEELLRLSNIFDNAGQVFLGILVISPLVSGKVDINIVSVIISGIVATLMSWFYSLYLTRKARKYDI